MKELFFCAALFAFMEIEANVLLGVNNSSYYASFTNAIVLDCVDTNDEYIGLMTGGLKFRVVVQIDVYGKVVNCYNIKNQTSVELLSRVIDYINHSDSLDWIVDCPLDPGLTGVNKINALKGFCYQMMMQSSDYITIPESYPISFPVRGSYSKSLEAYLEYGGDIPPRENVMNELKFGLLKNHFRYSISNAEEISTEDWLRALSLIVYNTTWYDILE